MGYRWNCEEVFNENLSWYKVVLLNEIIILQIYSLLPLFICKVKMFTSFLR